MPDPIQGVNSAAPIEIAQTGAAGGSSGTVSTSGSTTNASVDSADVARAEALLATIATTAGNVSDVDQARVAALQQAIQSGSYEANPQQIARKIIELEALLAPQGGSE